MELELYQRRIERVKVQDGRGFNMVNHYGQKKEYVFTGSFNSIDEACLYTEAQWQLEPD